MSAKTYTSQGLSMLYELELIDDAICGLYGQDCHSIYDIPEEKRKYLTDYLDRLLDDLRSWRAKYGFEYPA